MFDFMTPTGLLLYTVALLIFVNINVYRNLTNRILAMNPMFLEYDSVVEYTQGMMRGECIYLTRRLIVTLIVWFGVSLVISYFTNTSTGWLCIIVLFTLQCYLATAAVLHRTDIELQPYVAILQRIYRETRAKGKMQHDES